MAVIQLSILVRIFYINPLAMHALQDAAVRIMAVIVAYPLLIEWFHNITAHVKPTIHKFFLNVYASNHIIHLIAIAIAHLKNMQQVIIMIMI